MARAKTVVGEMSFQNLLSGLPVVPDRRITKERIAWVRCVSGEKKLVPDIHHEL